MNEQANYERDIAQVIAGDKPAVIVEKRKCASAMGFAYCLAEASFAADEKSFSILRRPLKDGHGKSGDAFVFGKDVNVRGIKALLEQRDEFSRATFQTAMGVILGYTLEDCRAYTESTLSLTCGCELCGGPTEQSRLDNEAQLRRTYRVYA